MNKNEALRGLINLLTNLTIRNKINWVFSKISCEELGKKEEFSSFQTEVAGEAFHLIRLPTGDEYAIKEEGKNLWLIRKSRLAMYAHIYDKYNNYPLTGDDEDFVLAKNLNDLAVISAEANGAELEYFLKILGANNE